MFSTLSRPPFSFRRIASFLVPLVAFAGLLVPAGCVLVDLAGVAAGKPPIAAAYAGLKGQHVGIMVWADHGIVIDHPAVQPDVARGLQQKLQQAAAVKTDEVRDIQWMAANDILKFQDAHPEMQSDSAQELAKRLNVNRLIYVEIGSLS